jgi:hypothetical protein
LWLQRGALQSLLAKNMSDSLSDDPIEARHADIVLQRPVREWWDEGKHKEAAATYLALPADLDYATSDDAKLAHANLERLTLLTNAVPFLASYVVS